MASTVELPSISPAPGDRRAGFRVRPSWGLLVAIGLTIVIAAPVAAVFAFVLQPSHGLWAHLVDTLLLAYLGNTALLGIGVGAATIVIGTGCAWLLVMYDFPGRRWLDWAMVLPLAMPAYVLAYAYTDFLQFTGPVQTALRNATGWGFQDYWFPPIHSVGGAIFVLSMALYPYVYVLARSAFIEQSVCALEVSRTLGCTAVGRVLPRGAAAGAAGDRGGRRVRGYGVAGRFRRGEIFRGADLHHRHLSRLVCAGQPGGRGATRIAAAALRVCRAAAGAAEPWPSALRPHFCALP